MYTIPQRALMASKWCASFFVNGWRFEHYPVWVRRNGVADPEIAWIAQFLGWPGPAGLGATPTDARAALKTSFEGIKTYRASVGDSIPRPGEAEPIRFAPSVRVNADPELLTQFVEDVLDFEPGSPFFFSDGSSLHDFGPEDEVERLRGKIRSVFGVETDDLKDALLADILERIGEKRCEG
ncbi:MAG: hypothetical protein KIS62_07510 [Ramlibacter sp.]|nr:hypothetical protein [Ramlibacter sp.]